MSIKVLVVGICQEGHLSYNITVVFQNFCEVWLNEVVPKSNLRYHTNIHNFQFQLVYFIWHSKPSQGFKLIKKKKGGGMTKSD